MKKTLRKKKVIIENQSLKIVEWIKTHPMFKWGVMCKAIGIDKSNFYRTLQEESPVIKAEVAAKIEALIKEYGYGK
jgi:F420-0:gamma-glutamyl ligase